jgi:hypothetical protein
MWKTIAVGLCITFTTVGWAEGKKPSRVRRTAHARVIRSNNIPAKKLSTTKVSDNETTEPPFAGVPDRIRELLLQVENTSVHDVSPDWRNNQCLLIGGRSVVTQGNVVYCRNVVYRYDQNRTRPWWLKVSEGKIIVQTMLDPPKDTYTIVTHSSDEDDTLPKKQFFIAASEP